MKKFLINHTNHPSTRWGQDQLTAAKVYGEIIDFPFPVINPSASTTEVVELVQENLEKILKLEPNAVLCQGEFNYSFAMVERLKNLGITALAATSERVGRVEILPDGSTQQISTFRFVRFREY